MLKKTLQLIERQSDQRFFESGNVEYVYAIPELGGVQKSVVVSPDQAADTDFMQSLRRVMVQELALLAYEGVEVSDQ